MESMRPLAKNFYLSIFLVLIAMASTNCKPADLESTCDVKSESFLLASLVRLATGDRSPSCLPAFSFLEEWGVYVSTSIPKVRSILSYRNHILMGGDFNKVGLSTGSVAILDKHSGTAIPSRFCPFLKVKGETYAAVPDGSGGFYIGGTFTHVQGIKRSQVAHILPGCQLDPNFNVTEDASRSVYTLHVLGDNLYVGGNFASWGSNPQSNIASVNRYTGELNTGFFPGAMNNYVYSIVSFGNSLFIGGSFDTIGAVRLGIAKLNATTGVVDTSFTSQLNVGGAAFDLNMGTDSQGSPVLYVGGSFSTPRNNATAFYPDGTLTSWAPNPNAPVEAIQQYENTVYLGGSFTSVLGAPTANFLVGVDNGSGTAVKNDFAIDLTVTSLHLVGNQLYALGQFTMAKGISRNYAAAFEVPSGALTNWNPSLDEAVSNPGGAVIPFGNDVVLGFNRYGVNLIPKKHFVVFDEATGYPLDNTPEFDFGIVTMHLKGDRLFLGGSFRTINGISRNSFAALDLPHYQLNPMDVQIPGITGDIRAIASGNGQVYFGGDGFTTVSGQTRNRVAAISEETLALTQWNPNVDVTGIVSSLLVVGDAVFIGGLYTSLNGNNTIQYYRAVDTVTGTAISLPSTTNYPQNDVMVQTLYDGKIYLGGSFTTISGLGAFNNFAIYDFATNSYQNSIYANGFVNAITPAPDGRVLVGGSFTGLNGSTTTPNVSAFQTGSYNILNWAPNPDSTVYTSFYHNGKWYVGGEFKDAFNKAYGGFFRTDLNEPPSN
ncbi:hypothetical protein EHQ62_06960 [Leptospira jelokensis]|uniref:Galactose oxidase n=1 Tax=Leptospira jelokensis TaxID=2484931 RepID=A0A4Z0ZVE9_9LEPT|nr:hypothetical protein EHQ62_06960 [Leptospira jelokensis]